ncbi:MAG TPA: hypothetical protein VMB81_18740 [Candidatus Sulfotelmatobacter sp.]|nr:hypothetical protein [Candidatus Sulfotelmatobacter sp.]
MLADNYNTLGQSLASGDLSGAQQAYASLIQSVTGGGASDPSSTTATTPSATSMLGGAGASGGSSGGSVGSDLVTLGQALSSGNLAGAQQAFSTLNQAVQAAGQGHGAHHGGDAKGGSGSDASSGGAGSSASSTITSQVTTTNADGTLTVTTTYADGGKSTTIEPNPNPTQSTNTLDPNNPGQLMALLNAQEQSRSQ